MKKQQRGLTWAEQLEMSERFKESYRRRGFITNEEITAQIEREVAEENRIKHAEWNEKWVPKAAMVIKVQQKEIAAALVIKISLKQILVWGVIGFLAWRVLSSGGHPPINYNDSSVVTEEPADEEPADFN
jgi:hypothetical protein